MTFQSVIQTGLAALMITTGCSSAEEPADEDMGGAPEVADAGTKEGTGFDPSKACEQKVVNAERGIPNVLVVLDRSGSMADGAWEPSVQAVKNVASAKQAEIAFGLMHFSGGNDRSSCSPGSMDVMPALDMSNNIALALDDLRPNGGTPTASSLAAAKEQLAGLEGQSYVLLITDGAPNCAEVRPANCVCTNGGGYCATSSCLDEDGSVAAVTALAEVGIPTFVIGYDTKDWTDTLNAMAKAGNSGIETYIPVDDGPSLEATLSDLSGSVISCNFELDKTPTDASLVHVNLNGQAIEHVDDSATGAGWELVGNRVEIRGSLCDEIKTTENPEIEILVECAAILL
ncbi:MAG: VWA domain-containing protein [Myxococcales bacterium]|nr:VWA domain-containing protein [Myxococcales bacterium]